MASVCKLLLFQNLNLPGCNTMDVDGGDDESGVSPFSQDIQAAYTTLLRKCPSDEQPKVAKIFKEQLTKKMLDKYIKLASSNENNVFEKEFADSEAIDDPLQFEIILTANQNAQLRYHDPHYNDLGVKSIIPRGVKRVVIWYVEGFDFGVKVVFPYHSWGGGDEGVMAAFADMCKH